MQRDEIRDALRPHSKRPIRAFLRRCDDDAESAFWDLVYDRTPRVPHDVAVIVTAELESSRRTVGELLLGWRPGILRALHKLAAARGQSDPWRNRGGAK